MIQFMKNTSSNNLGSITFFFTFVTVFLKFQNKLKHMWILFPRRLRLSVGLGCLFYCLALIKVNYEIFSETGRI